MPSRSKPGNYRKWNKRIRMECHGGKELLDSLADIDTMLQSIAKRADAGDSLAGHKVGVAQVCRDRMLRVRQAMIDGLKQQDQND